MNIKIIQIGNSKGIRIPKEILSQCEIMDRVDLKTKGNKIILEPINKKPREGWDLAAEEKPLGSAIRVSH